MGITLISLPTIAIRAEVRLIFSETESIDFGPRRDILWEYFIVSFGSITLSLRHCCRWLRLDILPWLPCKATPPPGWSVA
jgi:hypothetical protein